jgi:hypothetical protein
MDETRENELDHAENQRRAKREIRKTDAFFLILFASGTATMVGCIVFFCLR